MCLNFIRVLMMLAVTSASRLLDPAPHEIRAASSHNLRGPRPVPHDEPSMVTTSSSAGFVYMDKLSGRLKFSDMNVKESLATKGKHGIL